MTNLNCSGSYLLQHQEEGGLADREDEGGQLHRELHAWRHATEGERRHHERVQERTEQGANHNRCLGAWHRRAASLPCDQLWPPQQPWALHPQVRLEIGGLFKSELNFYILRIGRSGRFGRKGVAINFVKNDDIRILRWAGTVIFWFSVSAAVSTVSLPSFCLSRDNSGFFQGHWAVLLHPDWWDAHEW